MVFKNLTKNSRIILEIVAVFILILLSFFIGRLSTTSFSFHPQVQQTNHTYKKQSINKTFLFSVKNDTGVELTKIKYFIDSAELQNNIIINGQKATPVAGKLFLILTIRLTNDFDKNIQINSRDYVRLSSNRKEDLFAPNLHNDPVEVDAISTINTRIGFTVNQTDSHLVLHIGEIDEKKTILPLDALGITKK